MLTTTRYRITTPEGYSIIGAVQGYGSLIEGASGCDFLRRLAVRAAAGKPLPIYEPFQGSIAVFPACTTTENGPSIPIPLAGATIEMVAA